MSLNDGVIDTLDVLLPNEDSLLFKEPEPVPLNQDVFSSLDLPDFSNFSMEDVDFGDLEFLDLATAPLERNKRSNPSSGQYSDMYFNSLATPSGYCSANFLTEEANRLSVLLSDTTGQYKERGDTLEKSLLENLEDLFGQNQSSGNEGKTFGIDNPASNSIENENLVYEVPPDVLNLMSKNFDNLQDEFDQAAEKMVNPPSVVQQKVSERVDPKEYKQITIKSIKTINNTTPPPGAIAKIVIKTSKIHNFTRFTFASIDDIESHSFQVETSDLRTAIYALKPLNLDSVEVIRRLLKLGPRPPEKLLKPKKEIEYDIMPEFQAELKSATQQSFSHGSLTPKINVQIARDDENSIKSSLLTYGIKIDEVVKVTIASGQKFWCCPEANCQKAYGKGHELKLHILGHYNVKPFQCEEPGCSWGFVTKNKLNRHMASHNKNKSYTCNIQGCEKKFTTVYNLNSHLKLHERSFAHPCVRCEEKFQTERELHLHTSKEHKQEMEPNLKCPVTGCPKAYFTKSTLESHIKSHNNETIIKCSICEKVFDKPSRLKSHMIFHTGEKPYACDYEGCTWKFPTQSKLVRHKRTHTNDKKFICSKCNKAFGRSEHLQQHIQTHKEDIIGEHGSTLTGSSSPETHQNNNQSKRKDPPILNFQCPVLECSKKYVTKAAFKAHLKTVHALDLETCQDEESPPHISAGQLDFVALLSSVGEDVIGSDLNCPEYEISTELSDSGMSNTNEGCGPLNGSDILATSLSTSLHNFSDQGMLHLVEVDSEGGPAVQVVQMDDYLGMSSNTVLLQSYSATESNMTSNQGFFTLSAAPNNIQTSNSNETTIFSIPETMDNIIKLDTSGNLMSDGLITIDTSAISPGQTNTRKRNLSSIDAGGVPSKQRFRSTPGSNMPESDVRDLLGIAPSNSFGSGSQAPVMVQYSQEMAESQNQLSGAPSTINLQDLE